MLRVIVLHSAGELSRASCACHVPTTGASTSVNQKYGGPPCLSCDFAATCPFGAISENSPSSSFSVANMTRKGAPFQGAIGEVKTASSVASSQLLETWACESSDAKTGTKDTPVISNKAVTAERSCRARNN